MADVPFEVLLKQRVESPSDLARKRAMHGTSKPGRVKRENKNRPVETTSKRPVSRRREVLPPPQGQQRDPRFEDLTGSFSSTAFRTRYSFLYEEQLPAEREELKKAVQKTKSRRVKTELQARKTDVERQLQADKDRCNNEEREAQLKAREQAAVKAGKRPFYLKKSEKERQELVSRYHNLKAAGKLEKALAKRRKKNASRDKRMLPD